MEPAPEPIDTGRRRVYEADAMDAYIARLHARIAALHEQLRQATRMPVAAPSPPPAAPLAASPTPPSPPPAEAPPPPTSPRPPSPRPTPAPYLQPPPTRTDTVVAVGRQLAAAIRGIRRPPVSGLPDRGPSFPPASQTLTGWPPPSVTTPPETGTEDAEPSPAADERPPKDPGSDAEAEGEQPTVGGPGVDEPAVDDIPETRDEPDVFPWLEEPDAPDLGVDIEAEFWSRADHLDVVQDDSYFGELGEPPPG